MASSSPARSRDDCCGQAKGEASRVKFCRVTDLPVTRDLFYPSDERPVPFQDTEALLLGHDLEADILVVPGGAVVARLQGRSWFINSSRAAYGASLTKVGETRDALAGGVGDEDAHLEKLQTALREIDPDAFEHENSYWESILEQMRAEQF